MSALGQKQTLIAAVCYVRFRGVKQTSILGDWMSACSQNQTFSEVARCAYRFHLRVNEGRLPQRHYLSFFEPIVLTININIKSLPIRVEILIII